MRNPPPGIVGKLLSAYVIPVDVARTEQVPGTVAPIACPTLMPNPAPLQTYGVAVLAMPVIPLTHTAVL
jgi:hypothetical protein